MIKEKVRKVLKSMEGFLRNVKEADSKLKKGVSQLRSYEREGRRILK